MEANIKTKVYQNHYTSFVIRDYFYLLTNKQYLKERSG